jgi:hypothetical protein
MGSPYIKIKARGPSCKKVGNVPILSMLGITSLVSALHQGIEIAKSYACTVKYWRLPCAIHKVEARHTFTPIKVSSLELQP